MQVVSGHSAGEPRQVPGVQCWTPAARLARAGVTTLLMGMILAACATPSVTYDLRPALEREVPQAKVTYLDCDGVSDIVCECRRGGLEQEFVSPSRKHFDAGYAALIAYRDDPMNYGKPASDAEAHALNVVFTSIKADVEDICSYHEKEAAN